jgi:hypothetical protein
MKKYKFPVLLLAILSFSCKKERVCVCKNTIATYEAGTLESTKSYAKKYCKSLSNGETVCELKQ